MSNSKLLKEAIADAKAVRETAIANAKIALEEAFTPRLQSILSQKLQQEMEDSDDEEEVNEEYGAEDTSDADSSKIDGDNKQPQEKVKSSSDIAKTNPDTDVETAEVGMEPDEAEKAKVSENEEVAEGEDITEETEEVSEGEYDADGEEHITAEGEEEDSEEMEESYHEGEEESEEEDELDLEAIIRELEEELDDEEEEQVSGIASDEIESHEDEMHNEESEEEESGEEVEESNHEGEESEEDLDEEIDLNEILREMGYGEEEEDEVSEGDDKVEENNELEEAKAELEEAMSTIKELKSTINEVNLLNAKLLYTNKLFRSYDLTNEQKMKVVETLDRTGNVREVKLVFSTLAESFKFTGTTKKQKQTAKINESFASKPVASTAPKKEVINESTNAIADRFKKLANIK
jgi:hypothetical protein